MDSTPRILKNKGINVSIGGEQIEVRLTCGNSADIEEQFGSLEDWQEALQERPATTCVQTLSISTGKTPEELRTQMDSALVEYVSAIGAAWGVANGLDPTVAARHLTETLASLKNGADDTDQ